MSSQPIKTPAAALDLLEARIREQADVVPMLSDPWRAHMVDVAHINAVRLLLEDA